MKDLCEQIARDIDLEVLGPEFCPPNRGGLPHPRYYKDRIATANGMRWVVVDTNRLEQNLFDQRVLVADCTSEEAAQAAFVLMTGAS